MFKLLSVLTTFLIGVSAAFAATLSVGPGESIQDAINFSAPGDTIELAAGKYIENITIPNTKTGLIIIGKGANKTRIISAGGDINPKFAPATVPADIVIDIFAANVSISKLRVVHPAGETFKRDIGIFFRPPAVNGTVTKCKVKRKRSGVLEPTAPGSRGLLIFRATGINIVKNDFEGNYEDHIHLPTSGTRVMKNDVEDATRLGIVVIQETATSDSSDNIIMANDVSGSGSDGIQIQGDSNYITGNEVEKNNGAGIRLCGPSSTPACVAPGGSASADNNVVSNNESEDNAGGNILDFGSNNIVRNNDTD